MKTSAKLIGLLVTVCICFSQSGATVASDVLALTGNKHVRIAWSRYYAGGIDTYTDKGRGTFKLMSYSSSTDSVSDVLKTTGNYFRAKMSWDQSSDGSAVKKAGVYFIVDLSVLM